MASVKILRSLSYFDKGKSNPEEKSSFNILGFIKNVVLDESAKLKNMDNLAGNEKFIENVMSSERSNVEKDVARSKMRFAESDELQKKVSSAINNLDLIEKKVKKMRTDLGRLSEKEIKDAFIKMYLNKQYNLNI